jgi:hypothetical protein
MEANCNLEEGSTCFVRMINTIGEKGQDLADFQKNEDFRDIKQLKDREVKNQK